MAYQLTDEKITATIEAAGKCKRADGSYNFNELGRALGIDARNASRRMATLASRGLLGFAPVIPGFETAKISSQLDASGNVERTFVQQRPERGPDYEIPKGHVIKGVSSLVDADGRTVQSWIKTREGINPSLFVDDLAAHFANFKPCAKPTKAPPLKYEDLLALYPWGDPHFGVHCWEGDAAENWDLKIGARVMCETFAKVIARTPKTERAILLIGGDTLHADSNENKTARSGNVLQVDGRYPKVLLKACDTIVEVANMLLQNHRMIEIITLPGNHDEHASYAISFFLHAWFRNDPRVIVDISPAIHRYRIFGKVMLGMTHTHTTKLKDMPGVMAAREAEMWGLSRFRFAHGFHRHVTQVGVTEGQGCIMECHQIMAPGDAWHWGEGYDAGRSLKSIIYDREGGEAGRSTVTVLPARKAA